MWVWRTSTASTGSNGIGGRIGEGCDQAGQFHAVYLPGSRTASRYITM